MFYNNFSGNSSWLFRLNSSVIRNKILRRYIFFIAHATVMQGDEVDKKYMLSSKISKCHNQFVSMKIN